jgi:hypothetical protein
MLRGERGCSLSGNNSAAAVVVLVLLQLAFVSSENQIAALRWVDLPCDLLQPAAPLGSEVVVVLNHTALDAVAPAAKIDWTQPTMSLIRGTLSSSPSNLNTSVRFQRCNWTLKNKFTLAVEAHIAVILDECMIAVPSFEITAWNSPDVQDVTVVAIGVRAVVIGQAALSMRAPQYDGGTIRRVALAALDSSFTLRDQQTTINTFSHVLSLVGRNCEVFDSVILLSRTVIDAVSSYRALGVAAPVLTGNATVGGLQIVVRGSTFTATSGSEGLCVAAIFRGSDGPVQHRLDRLTIVLRDSNIINAASAGGTVVAGLLYYMASDEPVHAHGILILVENSTVIARAASRVAVAAAVGAHSTRFVIVDTIAILANASIVHVQSSSHVAAALSLAASYTMRFEVYNATIGALNSVITASGLYSVSALSVTSDVSDVMVNNSVIIADNSTLLVPDANNPGGTTSAGQYWSRLAPNNVNFSAVRNTVLVSGANGPLTSYGVAPNLPFETVLTFCRDNSVLLTNTRGPAAFKDVSQPPCDRCFFVLDGCQTVADIAHRFTDTWQGVPHDDPPSPTSSAAHSPSASPPLTTTRSSQTSRTTTTSRNRLQTATDVFQSSPSHTLRTAHVTSSSSLSGTDATQPLTVPPTAAPMEADPPRVVKVITVPMAVSASATSAAVATATLVPSAASQPARLSAMAALRHCDRNVAIPSRLELPLQDAVRADTDVALVARASLATVAACVVIPALAAVALLTCASREAAHSHVHIVALAAVAVPVGYFSPTLVGIATAVTTASDDVTSIALSWLAAAITAGEFIMVAVLTTPWRKTAVTDETSSAGSVFGRCFASLKKGTRDDSSRWIRSVFFIDISAAIAFCAVSNLQFDQQHQCAARSIAATLIALCFEGYLIVNLPYRDRVEQCFALAIGACQVAAGVVATISLYRDVDTTATEAIEWAGVGLMMGQPVVLIIVELIVRRSASRQAQPAARESADGDVPLLNMDVVGGNLPLLITDHSSVKNPLLMSS